MRFSRIRLFVSLAFLGLTQADGKAPSVKSKTVCTTAYCDIKGTRTQYVADETILIKVPASPCKVISTAVVTPRVRTITSIQPVASTITVTNPQQTDVATTTSFDFLYVYPTTTSHTTVTPIATAFTTVPNPADGTTTVTSYTLAAPAPLLAANGRRGIAEPLAPRDNLEMRLDEKRSPARLGKNVYCHKEVITTTTIAKPCKTFTSYSIAPRATTTSISTFLVQVTQTETPKDATTTLTIESLSTVTAPTSTSIVTDYAPTSTTTSTTTAAVAITTVVVGEYALCDPSRFSRHRVAETYFDTDQTFSAISANDPVSCCHAAFSVPDAVLFSSGDGGCYAVYRTQTNRCPTRISYDDTGSGPDSTFGAGSCGYNS